MDEETLRELFLVVRHCEKMEARGAATFADIDLSKLRQKIEAEISKLFKGG